MPQRIQLQRTKGWRKPEGTIVVARPSRWGNPFKVSRFMGGWSVDDVDAVHYGVWESTTGARAAAVALYEGLLVMTDPIWVQKPLRGHDLACWCPLEDADGNRVPCHADVLLELANAELAS